MARGHDLETLIGLFRDQPLDFSAGQRWKSSNSGYILLGAAIEKASGKSYEDYVEQELFVPLGMSDTRYGHQEEVIAGLAAGYVKGPTGGGTRRTSAHAALRRLAR